MSDVKVFGHIPPDTDSTCSAIVYAWYLSTFKSMDAQPTVGAEPNREAKFVLEHFGFKIPEPIGDLLEGQKVVIVDTNNPEELPKDIDKCEILEIVDHHKLAGLKTPTPLNITIRTYASVPTVIWEIMNFEQREALSPEMAGLMLAAIVSDSLKFTSSTTTQKDIEVAHALAQIAGEDIDSLAEQMFAAKSDLTGMSVQDILLSDYKVVDAGSKQAMVAVLETTNTTSAMNIREELIAEAHKVKQAQGLDYLFFFVVDIISTKAIVFKMGSAEDDLVEQAFGAEFGNNAVLELPGVVSRKKDMIPALTKAIEAS